MKRYMIYLKAAAALALGWLAAFAFVNLLTRDLPDIDILQEYSPPIITKLYDRHGKEFAEFYIERRVVTPITEIPVDLQNAMLAIEDTSFFQHWGINPKRIVRAFMVNVERGRISQGASTITQQLAKVMFLTRDKTIARKIKEVFLAVQLEKKYSKQEILQYYLNQIYFGASAYGVEAASKVYFDKSVRNLNLAESALLAGLPRAPSRYSPFNSLKNAYQRRQIVLKRMLEETMIDEDQYVDASATPISMQVIDDNPETAAYFKEYVRQYLEDKYGYNAIYKAGLKVYTTLDYEMQVIAEEELEARLSAFDDERATQIRRGREKAEGFEVTSEMVKDDLGVEKEKLSIFPHVQGSLLAMDPRSGEILAMVGGRDYAKSQFNRAVQARRQPGSGFKIFTYTAACDNGYSVVSELEDSPVVYFQEGIKWKLLSRTTDLSDLDPQFLINIPPDKIWIPSNYDGDYGGKTLLVEAVRKSQNLCAVDLIQRIGPELVVKYARKMGVTGELLPIPSLTLGTGEVTLPEMVTAYGIIANEGIKVTPYGIIKITDNSDKPLEVNGPNPEKCLSPQTAYIMNWLLQNVAEHGTGAGTRQVARPRGGKTGTTNMFTDAWFTGFIPEVVCGIWTGYDNNASLGKRKSGAVMAVPIWTAFMKRITESRPISDFHPPAGINFVPIDKNTGKRALPDNPDAVLMPFITGTEPLRYN
ncbi:MAG: penicillin-binding protein [Elusimicrobia bacterium CG_4_10_14_3_um_filter_49_12_50_7]|nr:MAG: penicillin-binding protein [Elusimicrobia bacterium CG_4_8_14_3_um_filter_50_9]PIY16724.1 MAG: penicillin-binding protein [Elusimicrobia bacterium CG_4_10_14_3_um_filter_49_12_50_7]